MTQAYLDLLAKVLEEGVDRDDRTGVGTRSLFGYQMRFNLAEGFPLLTSKKMPFGLIKSELLWFLKGDTNIRYLLEHKNHIWDEWAFKAYVESSQYQGPDMTDFGRRSLVDPDFNQAYQEVLADFRQRILTDEAFASEFGDLGQVYGAQWRSWQGPNGQVVDQISKLIQDLKTNPNSRRLVVSAWNPAMLDQMALPPCHSMFQFYVAQGKLSCQLYQRSGDVFLGVPFNIASYALLVHLVAKEVGLEVGEFIHTLGDVHLYHNHFDQARLQLSRQVLPLPQLTFLSQDKSLFQWEPADIGLVDYHAHPAIKAPIAV